MYKPDRHRRINALSQIDCVAYDNLILNLGGCRAAEKSWR
jgi:hypothetical protein